MAGSRKPGPLGIDPTPHDLNDGTLVRQLVQRPGPICASSPFNQHAPTAKVLGPLPCIPRKTSPREATVLREGERGADVERLQQLLNVRLLPFPNLKVDGVFGPMTQHAVLQYQKGLAIVPDGIAGKQTWYHLLKGDNTYSVPVSGTTSHISAATGKAQCLPPSASRVLPKEVWGCSLQEKFAEVLRRTAPKLPATMRKEFEALLSPANVGVMAATLVVWAGSHAFAVGEYVDVALLVSGVAFLGVAAFDVASDLGECLVVTSSATSEEDLDTAASYLARAVAVIGATAFSAILFKISRITGRRGGVTEGLPLSARDNLTVNIARPQPPKPSSPKRGLHNGQWDAVRSENFKTNRQVNTASIEEKEVVKVLLKQGRPAEQIEQVLSSGSNFHPKELKTGDKLYGFDSLNNPQGMKSRNSPYWMDESMYQDVKGKFYKDGQWDKEGVKNFLALPCYNRAEVIDTATVTKPHAAIESTIAKATEQIGYTKGDYSTGMIGKTMAGGGRQITPQMNSISAVTRVIETP
jgi:hypothetical protein